jgi:hypothetical protein
MGDVAVTWTVGGAGGGTTSDGAGSDETFTAHFPGGANTWTADYGGGITDVVTFTIPAPVVDLIDIVDTAATGGATIPDQVLAPPNTITGYAASFDTSDTPNYYMGDVAVTWTVGGAGGGTTSDGAGSDETFAAHFPGGANTWTADYGGGITDVVTFTIPAPVVDSIDIVDTAGTGAATIPDQVLAPPNTITGYAASFDSTDTPDYYMGDVAVTWTVGGAGGGTTSDGAGSDETFTAHFPGGANTWTADLGGGITDVVTFTIPAPVVDLIDIVDTAGTGAATIPNQVLAPPNTITGYAASFDSTDTPNYYMGDVAVTWTVAGAGGGTTSDGAGSDETFTAHFPGGANTWTADYGGGITDVVTFTIPAPVVDSIDIVDTAGTGAATIPDQVLAPPNTITGYAASFDSTDTPDYYMGDVAVTWTVGGAGGGTTSDGAGSTETFTAHFPGGANTWTADYGGGITDVVTFTIPAPVVDLIDIVDTAGTGAASIADQGIVPPAFITGYAASFDSTDTPDYYMGDVAVTWTVGGAGGGSTRAYPGGVNTWTADYGGGITDVVTFTIPPPGIIIVSYDFADGYNLWSANTSTILNLTDESAMEAHDLLWHINNQTGGGTCDAISRWDAASQTYDKNYLVGDPIGESFVLDPGYGYWVHIVGGAANGIQLKGDPATGGAFAMDAGWNIMGWVNNTVIDAPFNDRYLYSVSCQPVRGNTITAWDEVAQTYHATPYIRNFFDDDPARTAGGPPDAPGWTWDIEPGHGYWVYVNGASTQTY